ncbi:ATP-binding protein [Colwellia psychrerythraea]|uniref:histidine kinase n=1 Tax=Colwellia psychrerythraea TaxID=28229 RepID=A0A099KWW9_COLPS|nr:ATP-binding protein [Colwellia psychrerythraea]KGJ95081.1 putative cache sensor protein [Colwellia psychrerythraea]
MKSNLILAKLRKNIFLFCFIVFIVGLVVLTVFIYTNSKAKILNDTENAFSDRRSTLEADIARNTDFILVMKNIYDRYIDKKWSDDEIRNYEKTLKNISINHKEKGYYEIPVGKHLGSHQIYNSMFCYGDGSKFSGKDISQILVMLRMQNFQYAAQKNIKSLILSYYFTKTNTLTSIYPQISMGDILQGYDTFEKWSVHAYDVYDEFAPPDVNPKARLFWTEPYLDRTVNGMMVSTAIPTYLKGNYNGVIGADIELTFLNRFVKKSAVLSGETILVSQKGYVITGSDMIYQKEEELVLFSDLMSETTDIILFQEPLLNTPWKIVYLVSPNDILDKTLLNTRIFNIFIVATLVFSLIGYVLIIKFFIKPGIVAETNLVMLNKDLGLAKEKLEKNLFELKEAQKQIVESEKLAALGVLVVGIAHEINTPVGIAITSNSFLVHINNNASTKLQGNKLTKLNLTEFFTQVDDSTRLIANSLEKTAQLVNDFKLISVNSISYPLTRFNFKDYLIKTISVHDSLDENKGLEINIECDDLVLESYAGVFNLIIANLFENSMIHGLIDTSDSMITISMKEHKSHFEFIYADNGCGIPDSDKEKIFEPFYTSCRTKGTGLGLFTVHNMVKEKLKGKIEIKDTAGSGVTFIITWPRTSS